MYKTLNTPDGSQIAYQSRAGKNPGIVFLSGFMSDMMGTKASYLEEFCEQWGRSYVRFDYFGHGSSSGQLEEGTLSRWLEDVLLVIDTLTKGPQVLVGSSLGAWLMILAAMKRIERIRGLVGIAAAPDFTEDFKRLTNDQEKALNLDGICYIPSQYGGNPYPITRRLIEDAKLHYVLKAPIPLQCSVRLLHGLSDKDVSWQKSVQLAECLESKDVTITLIKEGDHRLSEESHLRLLAEYLCEFF